VVLRFFFSGSLFGILSGILVIGYQNDIFDPLSIGAITFTHTLTLGVMLSFMLAALFQMLPVIAGVRLTSPAQKANRVQYPFSIGVIMLLLAFNLSLPWLYGLASILLGGALSYVGFMMLPNLIRLPNHSASSKGITVALAALMLLVFLALYLMAARSGIGDGAYYIQVKTAHYSLGLFGWITLLIISISFQVIEMFYVTPPYPKAMGSYLSFAILILLVTASMLWVAIPSIWVIADLVMALLLSIYALTTLKRLSQRKRPVSDATLWFWRLGMVSLVLSMFCLAGGKFITAPWLNIFSYLFFAVFAQSIVFAMFYKIVPFLTWFHLNSQGYFAAPMMHEIIHPKTAKKHFWIHGATIIAFAISLVIPEMILLAGGLMMLSFGWMSYQVIHAHLIYTKTQKEGQKFDMGASITDQA